MTLEQMVRAVVSDFGSEGKWFSARSVARRVGADTHLARRFLDSLVRDGHLRSKTVHPSQPNTLPYSVYSVPLKAKSTTRRI